MSNVNTEAKLTALSAALESSPYTLEKASSISWYFPHHEKLSKATITPFKEYGKLPSYNGLLEIEVQFDGGRAIIVGRYDLRTSTLVAIDDEIGYSPQRRAAEFLNFQVSSIPEKYVTPQLRRRVA